MRREQFEHVIAAAADVSGEREIVVIGSQAILGNFPEPPETMLFSIEVDVYPLNNPDKADEIDGNLGDGSPFHGTHGYYAHGVGPETAVAPVGSGRTASSGSRFPRESGNRLKSSPSAWRFTIPFSPSALPVATAIGSSRATRSRLASFKLRSYSAAAKTFRSPRLIGQTCGGCSEASSRGSNDGKGRGLSAGLASTIHH